MNCSRCQAELADSATVCTACGTPTRISHSIPATFSYLPAGAPPWPTSVPENLPYSTIRTTGSVVETSGPATKAKSNVTARSVLIAAAILVLVPLLGAAITLGSLYTNGQLKGTVNAQTVRLPTPAATTPAANSTPSTSSQLPAASSFKKSAGATNLGIALKYPTNWAEDAPQTSTTSDYVRWHPQQPQYGILFVIQRFSTSTSTNFSSADDLNQQLITSFSGSTGVHSLQTLQKTNPQRTIGGTAWTEQDTGYLNDNGIQIRFTAISVEHNKMYYNIVLISPDIYYNEAMQKYIQPMFDSLQFLS